MHWLHLKPTPYNGNDLSPRQLLLISTCCGRIVWGIAITLLLIAGAATHPPIYSLKIPSYMLGFLIIFTGIAPLSLIHGIAPTWHKQSQACLLLSLLTLYFTPFLFWWSQSPSEIYYATNTLLCMLCIIGLLALLNALAASFAQRIKNEPFRLESRLSMWTVLAVYGIPLTYTPLYAISFILRHKSSPIAQIRHNLASTNAFFILLACTPLVLTAMNLWKTRHKCIELIRD